MFSKVSEPVFVATVESMAKVTVSPEIVDDNPVPPAIFKVSVPTTIDEDVEVSSTIVNVPPPPPPPDSSAHSTPVTVDFKT